MNVLNISVEAIVSYIGFRLQRRYSLLWVLRPVFKDLNLKMRRKRILGYKILCSGRFSREQIATYNWSHKGSLQYSTISSLVKYAEVRVRFKFGLGGIKLWLGYGCNNFRVVKRKLSLECIEYMPFKYSLKRFKNNINNYVILYLNYWFFSLLGLCFLKKKFNLYQLFLKLKIRWLLRFFVKRTPHYIRADISYLRQFYKFNNKLKFYNLKLIYWFKKYLKLLADKKAVTRVNIMKNLKEWACKENYRLLVGYMRRSIISRYVNAINKLIVFFRLIWIKNTKLLIFFKKKRWDYFIGLKKNKFHIVTYNQSQLFNKFII